MLDPDFEPQPLRCKVEQFHFSGHASRETIRAYVNNVAPSKIVLVHGDPPAVAWFKHKLTDDLPKSEVITPTPGEMIEL
jgi:mRNA degradation ribonuclease J1/J2